MKKLFLLIPVLAIATTFVCATPTITIDGDKSDWAEVPMLTQPGTWPMIKVLPAADANLSTNALAYMVENTEDFDPTWAKYPKAYIDKDYNKATDPIEYWAWPAMGADYQFTIGISDNGWKDFPVGITENNKAIEIGIPATYLTDLGSKFGFAMYYNNGAWYCPLYEGNEIDPANGLLYKTRSYTTIPGTVTAANAYAHQSIGECTDYVDFGLRDNGNDTARWAAFPVELVNPGKYDITAYVSTTLGWKFEFWLVDVATNAVVAHMDAPGSNVSSSKSFYNFGTMDLSSVPAGKYMLKVKNRTPFSTVKLHSVMLSGGVADVPCTLNPANAIRSDRAWVDHSGAVDSLLFTPRGSEGYNDQEWAKFKVQVTKAGYYNFTAHVCCPTGSQKYEIKLFNSDETIEKISNTNTSISKGDKTISTGNVELSTGVYVLRVRNIYNHAKSRLLKVVATYEGGAIIAVPDTLKAIEAIKSERAFVNASGELRFTDDEHDGYVRDQYGKWRLSVAKAGNYKFTVSANSDNAQAYELTLKNSAETVDIASTTKKGSSNAPLKFALDVEDLAIGNYVLNIRDTTNNSHGRIEYIAVSYEGGAVTAIPGQLLGEDALLYKSGSKYMIRTDDGYLQSSNNSAPTSEWAVWNITATAGTMEVTLNLDPVTSSGHNYRVELYDGEVLKDYAEELASSGLSDAVHSKGDVTLEKTLVIPADGSYTVKLINRTQYSSMILEGITIATYVAPAGVIMTDTDIDNSAWVANVGGAACDVQLNRTILGGMYNTICLPFTLNSTKCKAVFGDDVEIYILGSATLSGDILNLQFISRSDIWQGTPILIKTSTDIVNPVFEGVSFGVATADHTSGDAVTFRGTFVQKEFHNGDQVLLLVANNMLSYPLSDRTLKGFRAYFEVNNPQAHAPIRGARIIAGQNVVTSIDLVEAQTEGVTKVIENGQLIIIRDGVRLNALGVQVQ